MLKTTRKSEHILCVQGNKLLKCLYYRISTVTRKTHNGIVHRITQSNNKDICKEPQKILNSQSNPEHSGQN